MRRLLPELTRHSSEILAALLREGDRVDDDGLQWQVVAVARQVGDAVDDGKGRGVALADDGVVAVEDMHRVQGEVELGVVGVGSGVAEGEASGAVEGEAGDGLGGEAEADIDRAGDVAGDIAELDVEVRQDAVDGHAVVEAAIVLNGVGGGVGPIFGSIGEADEDSGGDGAFAGEEAAADEALGGVEDSGWAAGFGAGWRGEWGSRLRACGVGWRGRGERFAGGDDGDAVDDDGLGWVIVGRLQGVAELGDERGGGWVALAEDDRVAIEFGVGVVGEDEERGGFHAFGDGHAEESGAVEEDGWGGFGGEGCGFSRVLSGADSGGCGVDAGSVVVGGFGQRDEGGGGRGALMGHEGAGDAAGGGVDDGGLGKNGGGAEEGDGGEAENLHDRVIHRRMGSGHPIDAK